MEEPNETIKWSDIGGLNDQIREIREVDSLTTLDARSLSFPSQSPSSSSSVGIKAPKGVLLYGPPGTARRFWRRRLASTMKATFIKTGGVVADRKVHRRVVARGARAVQ